MTYLTDLFVLKSFIFKEEIIGTFFVIKFYIG